VVISIFIPEVNGDVYNGNSRIPTTQKVRMLKSQMKTMIIIFFDIKTTVRFEFISQDQTDNRVY